MRRGCAAPRRLRLARGRRRVRVGGVVAVFSERGGSQGGFAVERLVPRRAIAPATPGGGDASGCLGTRAASLASLVLLPLLLLLLLLLFLLLFLVHPAGLVVVVARIEVAAVALAPPPRVQRPFPRSLRVVSPPCRAIARRTPSSDP